jgi:hypothetical protein
MDTIQDSQRGPSGAAKASSVVATSTWDHFKQDHHYINQARQKPCKAFSSRVQKEYGFFRKSLPGGFLHHPLRGETMTFVPNGFPYLSKDGILVRVYKDITLYHNAIVNYHHCPNHEENNSTVSLQVVCAY